MVFQQAEFIALKQSYTYLTEGNCALFYTLIQLISVNLFHHQMSVMLPKYYRRDAIRKLILHLMLKQEKHKISALSSYQSQAW